MPRAQVSYQWEYLWCSIEIKLSLKRAFNSGFKIHGNTQGVHGKKEASDCPNIWCHNHSSEERIGHRTLQDSSPELLSSYHLCLLIILQSRTLEKLVNHKPHLWFTSLIFMCDVLVIYKLNFHVSSFSSSKWLEYTAMQTGLAKWLVEKLQPLSYNQYTINDTFEFVNEIRQLHVNSNTVVIF